MRGKEWILVERGRPLNTVTYESPSHNGTVLSGLNSLRSKSHFLDITLIADGESFQAHKVVLASCSDYFRAMFTDEMKESRQSEICLNGVSAVGMGLLLEYVYTSRLTLNLANVQDVLSAASHIQLVAVVEACSNYLQSQLDLENCVDIATISETYSLKQLRTVVYRFMCSHLVEFSRSPEFFRIHPQQMEHLLSCDFPVDCTELEVLEITLKWLKEAQLDPKSRVIWITRMIRKIHVAEVGSIHIDDLAESSEPWLARVLFNEMKRQVKSLKAKTRPLNGLHSPVALPHPPQFNSRGMTLAIVKVGGFGLGGITNEITYMHPSSGKWRHLTSIPHVEQCNFGTVVQHNDLYIVGGCFNQSLQEHIHPFGFRYSPRRDLWATMAPMQRERCRFSLNVLSSRIYAVGGVSEAEGPIDECERYDTNRDVWERVAPLPTPCTQHAATTLQHYLYVSGGMDRDVALRTMRRYNSLTDRWEELTSLPKPRVDHTMLTIHGRIYVCGGWHDDEHSGNRVLVDSIDCYEPYQNSWSRVTTVPTPRYHSGIVAFNNKIYFIGGYHSDAMFDTTTVMTECYDLTTGEWSYEEKYPQDTWEHTCVTLYIPTCRDDMEVLAATS